MYPLPKDVRSIRELLIMRDNPLKLKTGQYNATRKRAGRNLIDFASATLIVMAP
jgi:hypothetical protein